ncbi:hypothetical protein JD292_03070 [Leucobacter sp. CSA2]|uniref:Prealbumin-like fold domain-containing protein n=2 Tax=Leucobacter edaphi TaxID=2796472 RepID=A0A934QBF3_9MICO|nr:hypothetical protein [Leucobacter edaphi]
MLMAGAVLATSVVLGSEAPEAEADSALRCEAGYTYSVSKDGYLREIDPAGRVTQVGSGKWRGSSINGLGISQGGTEAFAYERWHDSSNHGQARGATILRYDAATGAFRNTDDFYNTKINGNLIAGAVDLSTGKYWFGGFEGVNRGPGRYELRFQLFEYDPAKSGTPQAFTPIGYFWTGHTYQAWEPTPAANGDMAFDAVGNLYAVRASATTMNIYTVTAEELRDNLGGELQAHATPTAPVAIPATNGIAFDADGTVNLGAERSVNRHDPNTWRVIESRTRDLQGSTDLANCASPASLTLRKNLVSRSAPSDQFKLAISRGATELDSQVTTGNRLGVQHETAGPTPVVSGDTYRISETGAAGADLADYDSEWVCRNETTGAELARGTGTSGDLTIPTATSTVGPRIVCDFTNQARGTLTLVKDFDIEYGAEAKPENWTLHATPEGGSRVDFASGETKQVDVGVHTIGEDTQKGYELKDVSCEANGKPLPVSPDGKVTLPANAKSVCTLTNTDLPGSVKWAKTDSVTEKPIGGSEWTIEGPGGKRTVVDHVGDSGYTGLDTDPAPGKLSVGTLSRGDYTLQETQAPAGYEITNGAKIPFTIASTEHEVELPAVTNRKLLTFAIEKYAFADQGSSAPELIDGAEFAIHRDDGGAPGDEVVDAVSPDSTGTFTVSGLAPGSYWLLETKAPAGYARLVEPVPFSVIHNKTHPNGALELIGKPDPLIELSDDLTTIRVNDARTVALPEAGGPGSGDHALWGALAAGAGLTVLTALSVLQRRRKEVA